MAPHELVLLESPAAAGFELPDGIRMHSDVDELADDPSLTADGRRRCVATTKAGGRCSVNALTGEILCTAHAGRLDSSAGGHAKALKTRLAKEEAERLGLEARLGTRSIVAAALREKAPEIRLAIHSLADRAAAGDRQAGLALIPWLNQGLGMPGMQGEGAAVTPGEGDELDLSTLDTASLRALLAR